MKQCIHGMLALCLVAAATQAHAQTGMPRHHELYAALARHLASPLTFRRVAQPDVTPLTKEVRLTGLGAVWGEVVLRPKQLRSGPALTAWSASTQPFGRQVPVRLDLEMVEVWRSSPDPTPVNALCLQSPAGSSGSAARWQHVIVVHRHASGRLSRQVWTSAYGSCGGIVAAPNGDLIAPVLTFEFESERSARSAQVVLHQLTSGQAVGRHPIHLPDPADFSRLTVDLRHPGAN